MANQEHLDILKKGAKTWNQWRKEHAHIQPDLIGADLSGADLSGADLSDTDLSGAKLRSAQLSEANLVGAYLIAADLTYATLISADLNHANLIEASLSEASLEEATFIDAQFFHTNCSNADFTNAKLSYVDLCDTDLSGANLSDVNLSYLDLSNANLSNANLSRAVLVESNLKGATLTQCSIYGISVWNVVLEGARQENLVITPPDEPTITVDNLKIAQFIYLLLNNAEIRDVIDTIARKAVLILGRFTPERKAVLDALRDALRTQGYVPILFDFDRPSNRNVTETVKTLAHLSRFIIADLTDPSSIPYELAQIVPSLAVPVQPVLLEGKKAFAMFSDLPKTYHWVLPTYFYTDQAHLLATLKEYVIAPAEQKAQELEKR